MKIGQKFGGTALLTALMVFLSGYCAGAATITVNPGDKIQDAINAAPDGSTIKIKAGTYNEVLVIDGRTKLKLIGAGAGKTIIDGNGLGTDLITINNSEKITLQECTLKRSPGHNIRIDKSHNVKIISNEIIDAVGGLGIMYLRGSKLLIKGNQILNNSADGIGFFTESSNNLITKNTIADNGGGGIVHQAGLNDRISNNIVRSNGGTGILNSTASVQVKSNTVVDHTSNPGIIDTSMSPFQNVYMKNIVQRNALGIQVNVGTSLLKNTVTDNTGPGIMGTGGGNTLIGNIVRDNTGMGIQLNGEGNYVKGNLVASTTGGQGLVLSGGGLGGNHILKNKMYDNASEGIAANGLLLVVSGNNCSNNNWGIASNGGSSIFTKNKINNNAAEGMSSSGAFFLFARNIVNNNSGSGIKANAYQSTFEKNKISGNTNGDGLSGFFASFVSKNKIMNNQYNGIDATSGANSLIEKNTVKGNGDGATSFDLFDLPSPTDDWWQNNKFLTQSL